MASRKDVERNIRIIKRWCRGPQILKPEQITELRGRFDKCKTLEDMHALQKTLEQGHKLPHVDTHTMEEASAKIAQLIYAYGDSVGQSTCGQDVNELIIAGPLDGQDHEVKCPRCGTMLDYTAPKADGEVPDKFGIGSPIHLKG